MIHYEDPNNMYHIGKLKSVEEYRILWPGDILHRNIIMIPVLFVLG